MTCPSEQPKVCKNNIIIYPFSPLSYLSTCKVWPGSTHKKVYLWNDAEKLFNRGVTPLAARSAHKDAEDAEDAWWRTTKRLFPSNFLCLVITMKAAGTFVNPPVCCAVLFIYQIWMEDKY